MNFKIQHYKSIPLQLINRNYNNKNAKRYAINYTNQNIWIPNKHLTDDGTIKENENIDYIFQKAKNKLIYAKIEQTIPGII